MKHVANLQMAVVTDAIHGHTGYKECYAITSGIRGVIRAVEVGVKIGQNREVLDPPSNDSRERRDR